MRKIRWILAAILDFDGHFEIFYLTAWHSNQNCSIDLTFKLVATKTKLLHHFEMTECHGHTSHPGLEKPSFLKNFFMFLGF